MSMMQKYIRIPLVVLAFSVAWFLVLLMDRATPFVYLGNPSAHYVPYQGIALTYHVKRLRTDCFSIANRTVIVNSFVDYLAPATISADYIRRLANTTPGEVRVLLRTPGGIEVGDTGTYSVELVYECNFAHKFWPITVRFDVDFEIQAPKAFDK